MILKHMRAGRCTLWYIQPQKGNDKRHAEVVAGDLALCRLLLLAGYGYYSVVLSYGPGETTPAQMERDRKEFLEALLPGLSQPAAARA
jgi:hypothetical protein